MITLTKQQEFDLLFKYTKLGFTSENLYSETKWEELNHAPYRFYITSDKEFLLKYKDCLDIENLSHSIPEHFMNDFEFFDVMSQHINFRYFSVRIKGYSTDNVSVLALRRYKDKLNWRNVHIDTPIEVYNSEEFLNEFKDVLYWANISYDNMSEELIEKFKNKVSWKNVCCRSNLTEDFIRRNKRKIAWKTLCQCRDKDLNFSVEFMKEFDEKMHWEVYVRGRKTLFT